MASVILCAALAWQWREAEYWKAKANAAEFSGRIKGIFNESDVRQAEALRNRFNASVEERNALARGIHYKPSTAWAWYQSSKSVFHNHPLCREGDVNAQEVWLPGTGGKQLCSECARRARGESE